MPDVAILPPLVRDAVDDLKRRLTERFAARLRELRVFGSVARGEADEHSDVDVLVVLDRIDGIRERILPRRLPTSGSRADSSSSRSC